MILLIDPVKGVNSQDQSIANHILTHYKSGKCLRIISQLVVIVAINKWDLLRQQQGAKDSYGTHVREQLRFMDFVPVEYISSKTGYRVENVMDLAVKVFKEREYPCNNDIYDYC